MNYKFLHIVTDEKFIDVAIEQFETVAPGANEFVFLNTSSKHEFRYIVSDFVRVINVNDESYLILLNSLIKFKAVLVHYLSEHATNIINHAPEKVKLVWMFWGQDAQKLFVDEMFKPDTKKVVRKISGLYEYFFSTINKIRRPLLPFRPKGRAFSRITFCAPVVKEELEDFEFKLPFKYKYLDFTYGFLEYYIPDSFKNLVANGENIIVGQSSSAGNNHLDAFNVLRKIGLPSSETKLIVPLSYGNKEYGKTIATKGKIIFKENFHAIDNFLPLQEYYSILFTCSYAIMNHKTQQALGNILMLLWIGCAVYLNPKNPIYRNFISKGFIIKSVNYLENGNLLEKLTKEERLKNRELLVKHFKREVILEKTCKLLKAIS